MIIFSHGNGSFNLGIQASDVQVELLKLENTDCIFAFPSI